MIIKCETSIASIPLKNQDQRHNRQHHLASHTRGQAKVVIGAWNRRKCMVEKQV